MTNNKFNSKFRCYDKFVTASGKEILLDSEFYRHDAEAEALKIDPTAKWAGLAVMHGTYRVCG